MGAFQEPNRHRRAALGDETAHLGEYAGLGFSRPFRHGVAQLGIPFLQDCSPARLDLLDDGIAPFLGFGPVIHLLQRRLDAAGFGGQFRLQPILGKADGVEDLGVLPAPLANLALFEKPDERLLGEPIDPLFLGEVLIFLYSRGQVPMTGQHPLDRVAGDTLLRVDFEAVGSQFHLGESQGLEGARVAGRLR